MARKMTATEKAERIAADAEDLVTLAKTEIRADLADELSRMIKGKDATEMVRSYLRTEDGQVSYLPGVDADTFEITPEIRQGMEFMLAALKDKDFEF